MMTNDNHTVRSGREYDLHHCYYSVSESNHDLTHGSQQHRSSPSSSTSSQSVIIIRWWLLVFVVACPTLHSITFSPSYRDVSLEIRAHVTSPRYCHSLVLSQVTLVTLHIQSLIHRCSTNIATILSFTGVISSNTGDILHSSRVTTTSLFHFW